MASNLFTSEERKALELVLRRMGQELKPRHMPRVASRAYDLKVGHATQRVLAWLEDPVNHERTSET